MKIFVFLTQHHRRLPEDIQPKKATLRDIQRIIIFWHRPVYDRPCVGVLAFQCVYVRLRSWGCLGVLTFMGPQRAPFMGAPQDPAHGALGAAIRGSSELELLRMV